MENQPQLVLLQKTLLNIEGQGRQLYPDLDLWTTAKPFLENWMEDQVGPRAMLRGMKENMPHLIEKMPEMPGLIYAAMKNMAEDKDNEQQLQEIRKVREEIKRGNQRTVVAIAGASLLMSAFIVFGLDGFAPTMVLGAPLVSWVLGGIGAFFLLFAFQD